MAGQILRVPYLGGRNYVHGTTMFGLLKSRFTGGTQITFKVGRLMPGNEVELVKIGAGTERAGAFPCTGQWEDTHGSHRIGIRETGGVDASLRAPFPEEAIVASAVVDAGGAASLGSAPSCEFIEAAVALNKAMLQNVHPPAPGEQYLFTRIDLERMPDAFLPLEVRLSARIADAHFVSEIRVGGAVLGKIYFSKWKIRP